MADISMFSSDMSAKSQFDAMQKRAEKAEAALAEIRAACSPNRLRDHARMMAGQCGCSGCVADSAKLRRLADAIEKSEVRQP